MATKKASKSAAKAPAKKGTAKKGGGAIKPISEPLGKSGLVNHIAERTELPARDVRAVLTALEEAAQASLGKKGCGVFTLPGMLKITRVDVPAKPRRKGINPFTKEEQWFAAKPASVKLKARPMKRLKDSAA
ncbi:MAG TPA: HU family DNA-binding protein [Lysobacter sp.]|nr:HU family DNA-binding protein [Lysobacter sp.]